MVWFLVLVLVSTGLVFRGSVGLPPSPFELNWGFGSGILTDCRVFGPTLLRRKNGFSLRFTS